MARYQQSELTTRCYIPEKCRDKKQLDAFCMWRDKSGPCLRHATVHGFWGTGCGLLCETHKRQLDASVKRQGRTVKYSEVR